MATAAEKSEIKKALFDRAMAACQQVVTYDIDVKKEKRMTDIIHKHIEGKDDVRTTPSIHEMTVAVEVLEALVKKGAEQHLFLDTEDSNHVHKVVKDFASERPQVASDKLALYKAMAVLKVAMDLEKEQAGIKATEEREKLTKQLEKYKEAELKKARKMVAAALMTSSADNANEVAGVLMQKERIMKEKSKAERATAKAQTKTDAATAEIDALQKKLEAAQASEAAALASLEQKKEEADLAEKAKYEGKKTMLESFKDGVKNQVMGLSKRVFGTEDKENRAA